MTTRWVIGLASGSSATGVDAALLQVEGTGLGLGARPINTLHQAYPPELRELLQRTAAGPQCELKQLSLLHRLLGETFATAARQVADRATFSLMKVQCVGMPGHTVWHEPEGRFPSAFGLGMAAVVAERTGLTTVSDFRARDMAAGGQGVPLATLADYLLFRDPRETRVVLHLGGIARVSYLPAGAEIREVIGFEAVPCNVLLDGLMRQLSGGREPYDTGGKHAVQGCCNEELLQRWLRHPYLQRRPPKSLPRHGFGEEFNAQAVALARQVRCNLHDLLCTASHFVARGIAHSIRRFLPESRPVQRVLLSGRGVRNGLLWHLLEQQFGSVPLTRTDQLGIPADVRKAVVFGLLATFTVDGVAGNLPSATGAAGARLLGSITPGSPANWARCLTWMAGQTAPPVAGEW